MSRYDRGEHKSDEDMEGKAAASPPASSSALARPANINIRIQWLDGSKWIEVLSIEDTLAVLWDRIEQRTGTRRGGLELLQHQLLQLLPQRVFREDSLHSTFALLGLRSSSLIVRRTTDDGQGNVPLLGLPQPQTSTTSFRSPGTLRNMSKLIVLRMITASNPPKNIGDLPSHLAQEIIDFLTNKKKLKAHHLKYFAKCCLHLTLEHVKDIAGDLRPLKGHTYLKGLSLRNMPLIMNKAINCLTGLKHLTYLNLGDNKRINDGAMPYITEIETLKTLMLYGTGITDRGVEVLCKSSPPNLCHLSLSETPITDQAMEHLHLISKLESLMLVDCNLSSVEGLERVTSLTSLNLSRTFLTMEGVERLTALVQLESLRLTQVDSIDTDEALLRLRNLHLNELSLPNKSALTDIGIFHLITMPLSDLDLSGCVNITDDGLLDVGTMIELKSLSLEGTRITDVGLLHLTGLINLSDLTLKRCHMTDAGATLFTSLRNLENLDLSFTNITNLLLTSECLNNCRYLKTLNLMGTSVTSAGFELLVLPSLSSLIVKQTNIDPHFLPALPGCPLAKFI